MPQMSKLNTSREAARTDFKYLSYQHEMDGWKVLENCYLHVEDRGLDSVQHSVKDGLLCYEDTVVGIALFGLGRIGTIHFEHLIRLPRVQILYCVEQCQERARYVEFKWRLTSTKIISPKDADIVYKDPRVTAVVICTPTYMHEDIVLKALGAGKAVFCEKPLSNSIEGVKKCYAMAKKAQKPLLCAFNRRFDPGVKNIKDRVMAGEIGDIQVIKTCSRDCPLPSISYLKTSGGIFHDCAVHDIDLICWIMEEFPVSVTAYGHAFIEEIRELGDYDTVGIMMKFPSGALGIIDLSRNAVYGYDQRVEVFGPKGMLTSAEDRPTGVASHSAKGKTAVPIYYSFASRYHNAYVFELDHFLEAVQGKCKVSVEGRETIAVSRIAEACEESAKTGKTIFLQWNNEEITK